MSDWTVFLDPTPCRLSSSCTGCSSGSRSSGRSASLVPRFALRVSRSVAVVRSCQCVPQSGDKAPRVQSRARRRTGCRPKTAVAAHSCSVCTRRCGGRNARDAGKPRRQAEAIARSARAAAASAARAREPASCQVARSRSRDASASDNGAAHRSC